ncbi:MAG: hypothetical protein E6R07_12505 [Nevskiaceae bacterium]|nr:MAG: hypothetical protein E6R07_12505 [Nevskiaceae bacterium]
MKHTIVIQRHRPWLRPALIAGGSAALALGGFALYSYTRTHTVSDFERAQLEVEQLRDERRQLTRDLREARKEVADLKDQVVYVQRSGEIDTQACGEVKNSLASLQAEAADLREQLAFYRGIVSPDLSKAGVRIYDLKLTRGADDRSYRYELALIQSVRHDRRIDGRIDLAIEGIQGGARQSLRWDNLVGGDAKNLLFSFKYFEEFSGELHLPPGFKPLRVSARLVTDVEGAPPVEDQFDWAKIVASP